MWVLVFFYCINTGQAKQSEDDIHSVIQNFINAVKTDNAQTIAKYVAYPLKRRTPVPDIHNEDEFVEKYSMLLDEELKKAIVDSKLDDWDSVGWRGIMLYNGLLWLNEHGKLIALNSMTLKEQEYSKLLTEKDKKSLYPVLKNYNSNIYIFNTSKGRGRIDEIYDKNIDKYHDEYRYAFWNKVKNFSEKPDIIISGGEVEYYGSAQNTSYIFQNGPFTYRFDVTYVGPMDMIPYELLIYKNGDNLASYPATIIK